MVKEKLFYVYFLIDPSNDKVFYIGKGHGNRMFRHKDKSLNGSHHNKHVQNKILKIISNGLDIKYEKIFESYNEIDALNKEIELIELYGLDNLCNSSCGGEGSSGYKMAESTKEKLRKIFLERDFKGKNNPNYGGGNWSQETKENFSKYKSIAQTGKGNSFYGKKHSDEVKAIISKTHKGKTISDAHRKAITIKLTGTKRPKNIITSSGENNCKAILKFWQVKEIRDKWIKGNITQIQLANEYGINKSTVSNIIVRKTWNKPDTFYEKNME
jgi:hypothetical protein